MRARTVFVKVLSTVTGEEVRIPNADQADGNQLLNVVDQVQYTDAEDTVSFLEHPITDVTSPNDDDSVAMQAAVELTAGLLG